LRSFVARFLLKLYDSPLLQSRRPAATEEELVAKDRKEEAPQVLVSVFFVRSVPAPAPTPDAPSRMLSHAGNETIGSNFCQVLFERI
jgi:hypothetical protein